MRLILIVILFLICGNAYGQQSIEHWQGLFDSKEMEYADWQRSGSGDAWHLYNLAYHIDAENMMLIATGDIKYLNRCLLMIENTIATSQLSSSIPTSQYQDSYQGWPNHSHTELGDDGREYALFESYMWRYVCHTLRLIRQTPWIYNAPHYRARYNSILAFTELHIWEKWWNRETLQEKIFRIRTHMSSHWAYIATELALITTNPTRLAEYELVRDGINSTGIPVGPLAGESLRGNMIYQSATDSYIWYQDWANTLMQDVSHGNNVLSFIVESHLVDDEWTDTDIERFINTLDDVIWPSAGGFTEYVDGSGTGNGWLSDGLAKLGRYSRELQDRFDGYSAVLDRQLCAACALNERFLTTPGFDGSSVPDYATQAGDRRVWLFSEVAEPPVIAIQPASWWWNTKATGTEWQEEWDVYEGFSESGDSWNIYPMGFVWHNAVKAFEVTGDTKYLDRGLWYAENIIGTAVVSSSLLGSTYQDSYLSWGNHTHEKSGDDGQEYPLFESHGWCGVADMLRLVHDTPDLWNNSEYRAKYDTILAWTETNIWEKWYTRSLNHIYRVRTHMASHWARMAVELYGLTGTTKDAEYLEVMNNFNSDGFPVGTEFAGSSFSANLRGENGRSWWYSDFLLSGDTNHIKAQDIGHAGAVVSYIIAAHDNGYPIWDPLIPQLVKQLDEMVWLSPNAITDNINGEPFDSETNRTISNGLTDITRFSRELQAKLEGKTATLPNFRWPMILDGVRGATQLLNGEIITPDTTFNTGWVEEAIIPTNFMAAGGTSYIRCRAPWTAPLDGEASQIGFYLGSTWGSTNAYAAILRANGAEFDALGAAPISSPNLNSWNWIDMPAGIAWSAGDEILTCIATDDTAYLGRELTGGDGMYYRTVDISSGVPAVITGGAILAGQNPAFRLRWK